MKCLYYLAPTLDSTHGISDDLHAVGIRGLKKQHIHSSNYLETLDVVRGGVIGGVVGFIVGLVGVALLRYFDPFGVDALLRYFDPFGVDVPNFVYYAIIGVATLFGTWEGGLIGIGIENRKLAKFHDDIQAGKFLVLIYALKEQEERVQRMMRERHPESELAAIDRHFINPFSSLKRGSESGPPADQLLQKE